MRCRVPAPVVARHRFFMTGVTLSRDRIEQ
jgi:hypothetical protein